MRVLRHIYRNASWREKFEHNTIYLNHSMDPCLISCAFYWFRTPEGRSYWTKVNEFWTCLNVKWLNYYK